MGCVQWASPGGHAAPPPAPPALAVLAPSLLIGPPPMAALPCLRGLPFYTLAQGSPGCSHPRRRPSRSSTDSQLIDSQPCHPTYLKPTSPNAQGLTLPISLGTQKPLSPATKPVGPTHCSFPARWPGPIQQSFPELSAQIGMWHLMVGALTVHVPHAPSVLAHLPALSPIPRSSPVERYSRDLARPLTGHRLSCFFPAFLPTEAGVDFLPGPQPSRDHTPPWLKTPQGFHTPSLKPKFLPTDVKI